MPPAAASSNCKPGSRKLLKQATFALGFSTTVSSGMQEEARPRSESLDLSPSLTNLNTATEGKGLSQVGKSRRSPLSKQQSIHSDVSGSVGVVSEGGRTSSGAQVGGVTVDPSSGERLWRGLRLDLLRSRIQRLIVVMNTSEPGSIPDAGMLASLVDLVSCCCVDCYLNVTYVHMHTRTQRRSCSNIMHFGFQLEQTKTSVTNLKWGIVAYRKLVG